MSQTPSRRGCALSATVCVAKKRKPPGPGTTANAATTATSHSHDEAVDVATRRKHNADANEGAAAP